jgi:hypothetical protein
MSGMSECCFLVVCLGAACYNGRIEKEIAVPNPEDIALRELIKITDFESDSPDYVEWKRAKIERAIRHADEHPDDFATEKDIWNKHGLGN